MTTIKQPAPTTLQEADEVQDITVKDLIATLQTYPEDYIVFPVPIGQVGLGAELVAALDQDTQGLPVYSIGKPDGVNLVDFEDQPK